MSYPNWQEPLGLLCPSTNRRDIMNIKDFPCGHDSGSGAVSQDLAEKYGLEFPSAYKYRESIYKMAKINMIESKAPFCLLPFCTTLEGEALGSNVVYSESTAVPRLGPYNFTSLDELIPLPSYDLTEGRIKESLEACRSLVEDKSYAVLEISGPFTILANLLDMRLIMRAWRKDREKLFMVFREIADFILDFSKKAIASGAQIICYADPTGSYSILGPKFSQELMEEIVLPLVKNIEAELSDSQLLHLCPKTSNVLVALDYGFWQEVSLGKEEIPYRLACVSAIGKARIIGENCIKNRNYNLKNGNIKSLVIK